MNGVSEPPNENKEPSNIQETNEGTFNDPESELEVNETFEKSQNDHLNKTLLCSFLEKLNQTPVEAVENGVDVNEDDEDEFKDEDGV